MTGLNSNKLGFYASFSIEEEYFQHNYLQTQRCRKTANLLHTARVKLEQLLDEYILLWSEKSILSEYWSYSSVVTNFLRYTWQLHTLGTPGTKSKENQ